MMTVWTAAMAEPAHGEGCFRSVHEAAAGAGVRDGDGFRLEGIRLDRLAGGQWATVRSCLHPERPGMVVKVVGSAAAAGPQVSPAGAAVRAVAPLVHAGQAVQVLRVERSARLEMGGVAQADAAVGARVRVRLAAPAGVGAGQAERFAQGTVRADGVVELEAAQ